MALRIAILCVATAIVCLTIRVSRPEIALATALAAGLVACLMSLSELREVVGAVTELARAARAEGEEMSVALRACGLALIGEYAGQLCRDAGEGALAQRVEFAMRVSLLAMMSPLAVDVMGQIAEILP